MTQLKEQILDYSRQNKIAPLSTWFDNQLDIQIENGQFKDVPEIMEDMSVIVDELVDYRENHNIENVVLGMSGGVDSALTAALFKKAGWNVLGVTLPINQNPEETARGTQAIAAIGIRGAHIDLTNLYTDTLTTTVKIDTQIYAEDKATKIRRGNLRARLRMVTLYNLASLTKGLVASTDNFSELAAGFWTLHGDVGDIGPIQMCNKSWEVPMMSKLIGVPEATYRATPTDGLGIDAGDEAQLGATYLEWDLIVNAVFRAQSQLGENTTQADIKEYLALDEHADVVFDNVVNRIKNSGFKRNNPYNIMGNNAGRNFRLNRLDSLLGV